MRLAVVSVSLTLFACANDVRPTEGREGNVSDPGVDGGLSTEGGSTTTDADARVPPPDGTDDLAPCDAAPYHSDFQFLQNNIFTPTCAQSGCHTGASPDAGMSLDAGRAHASLVNVASTQFDGWVRVVPNDPGASMLMVQVGGEPGPELEGFMPWNQPRLCDPLVDAMRRWIAAGAPQ